MSTVVVVGSCNLDFIIEVPTLPVPGETVLGGDVACRPGGKGANQAVAAKRLGAATSFVGAVGDDQFGVVVRSSLESEGIDLTQMVSVGGPTGVALIVVDRKASNQITVAPGANGRLRAEHLDGLCRILAPASVLLLQLEIPIATCVAAARVARDSGSLVLVNAAPLSATAAPDLESLLALTDVLIVNEGEALSLSAASPPTSADGWRELAGQLSAARPPSVVVTLGDAGAVAASQGESFFVPSHRVQAIDSTGAGDAFCGAVAVALAEKRPLREAVRRGCAAGALATTAVGAQAALPAKTDIEFLDTQLGGN